jgi:putative spermidine/putrescine transport system permease protein
MAADAPAQRSVGAPSRSRQLATWLHSRPRLQLGLLLAAPLVWLGVVYLGSLAILLLNAFWATDSFTGEVIPFDWSLEAFQQILGNDVYRTIAARTVVMAILVTVTDALLAFPIAYYMARVASPRTRNILVVAVLMPLWASYLVKAYAWRTILSDGGIINWALEPLGVTFDGYSTVGLWLVFTYLWLPFMVLPIYAGLERIPSSLLEASADLGGRSFATFTRVILPLALPAVVAGSIFTFSLTLGDYIAPGLITSEQFIGTVIYSIRGEALPVAAAYSFVPIIVMIVYLLVARRLGAFQSL